LRNKSTSLSAISKTICGFIIARIVTGVGVGAVTYATPQYTSELAPKETRGKLTSLFQLSTVGGVVLAQAITLKHEGMDWSVPFILPCVPAALIAAGIFYYPESPRWVMTNASCTAGASAEEAEKTLEKARGEVRSILRQLRGDGPDADAAVEAEYADIVSGCERQRVSDSARDSISSSTGSGGGLSLSGYGFLRDPDLRHRSLVACFMQLAQQLTGINGFTTLGAQFFRNAGVEDIYLSNFLPSLTSFVGTCLQLHIIDSVGRRPLLLTGMGIMGCSVLASALLLTPGVKAAGGGAGGVGGAGGAGGVGGAGASDAVHMLTFTPGTSEGGGGGGASSAAAGAVLIDDAEDQVQVREADSIVQEAGDYMLVVRYIEDQAHSKGLCIKPTIDTTQGGTSQSMGNRTRDQGVWLSRSVVLCMVPLSVKPSAPEQLLVEKWVPTPQHPTEAAAFSAVGAAFVAGGKWAPVAADDFSGASNGVQNAVSTGAPVAGAAAVNQDGIRLVNQDTARVLLGGLRLRAVDRFGNLVQTHESTKLAQEADVQLTVQCAHDHAGGDEGSHNPQRALTTLPELECVLEAGAGVGSDEDAGKQLVTVRVVAGSGGGSGVCRFKITLSITEAGTARAVASPWYSFLFNPSMVQRRARWLRKEISQERSQLQQSSADLDAAAGLKAAAASRLEETKKRALNEGVEIVDAATPFAAAGGASGRAAAPVAGASARAAAPVAGGSAARQSLVKVEPGLGVGLGDGTQNPAVRIRGWSRQSVAEAIAALSRQRMSLVGQDEARRKRLHRLHSVGDMRVRHSIAELLHTIDRAHGNQTHATAGAASKDSTGESGEAAPARVLGTVASLAYCPLGIHTSASSASRTGGADSGTDEIDTEELRGAIGRAAGAKDMLRALVVADEAAEELIQQQHRTRPAYSQLKLVALSRIRPLPQTASAAAHPASASSAAVSTAGVGAEATGGTGTLVDESLLLPAASVAGSMEWSAPTVAAAATGIAARATATGNVAVLALPPSSSPAPQGYSATGATLGQAAPPPPPAFEPLNPRRFGFVGFALNLVDLRRPALRRSLMYHTFGNAMIFRTAVGAMDYAMQVG
jgi:hypothetical protein